MVEIAQAFLVHWFRSTVLFPLLLIIAIVETFLITFIQENLLMTLQLNPLRLNSKSNILFRGSWFSKDIS